MAVVEIVARGPVGAGKSALLGEIEIALRAIGVEVAWPDGQAEKNMTHAEWADALDLYKPTVRLREEIA
jgi:hypothetical protein